MTVFKSNSFIKGQIFGTLIALLTLSACDFNHLSDGVEDYQIQSGEMKARHEANAQKSFPNLGDVPERVFFDDTDDFDSKNKTDQSIEIASQYAQSKSENRGPFSLVNVKKVTKHFLLADTVVFEGDEFDFLPNQEQQVLKFGKNVQRQDHKIVVVAKRNESLLGFDTLGQKRLKRVVRLLLSSGIRSDRIFYGYSDQLDESYFPSLDRMQDNELKVFTR
ncbi:MAG: hypothetical protein KBE16_03620 [Alphaproteobacteria bacterium]|nr:hypothetical protein [Alphaproteobacteria bacterium]MBP9877241.1 hypothetical protein [Alphaproteobacteria bacterium]